ncbi:hypothetical protein F4781DRAFT_45490 [Annulohypoxylon bovei var. microspora]|nr:hypothetical protein F4781DRAFT_45490 [Annulohypoxylon bovei var. microspora]
MASASASGSRDAALLKAQVDRLEKALKELTIKKEKQAENPDDTTSSPSPSSANDTNLRWERFEWWKLPRELRLTGPENKISDAQIRARFIRGPENKTTDTQMWARFIRGAEEWTTRQRTLLEFRSRIGKATSKTTGKGDSHITDQDGKRY